MPTARLSISRQGDDMHSSQRSHSGNSLTDVYLGEDDDRTPYERVLYGLHHDQRWVKEITLGRRVGFYRFRGELGQGNFSTVRLAYHQLTRDKVAVKVIDKSKLDQKTQRMLAREIANMDLVAHPNIIRLFEVVETLSRIHLVMEFASGGELFNKITADGRLSERDAQATFQQVLAAVSYLHGLNIIHRDIKAENVFLAGPGVVKLGDFGFSTRVDSLAKQLATFCGSPPYAAPELYKDESYVGPAVDVWALGVLLFFILTADMPFKGNSLGRMKKQIIDGDYIIPPCVSTKGIDLISHLLVQSPQRRLTTAQMARHSWLSTAPAPPPILPTWVTTMPQPEEKTIPEVEKSLQLLESWGISRNSVLQENKKGARSVSVATYRILAHRFFIGEEEALGSGISPTNTNKDYLSISNSNGASGSSSSVENSPTKKSSKFLDLRKRFESVSNLKLSKMSIFK